MLIACRSLWLFFILSLAFCCNSPQQDNRVGELSAAADTSFYKTSIAYARQFRLSYGNGYKLAEVLQAYPGAENNFRYLLLPKGMAVPEDIEADAIVRVPVETMVSLSTTHIPSLDMLGASNTLIGFPTTDLISSPKMRQRIKAGQVQDLGASNGINIEKLMELSPDMVMAYGMGPQDKSLRTLNRTQIPVVLNADYMEQNPLGRAEWIKFTAAFLNKEKEADSIFSAIESRYDSLKALTAEVAAGPAVFSGVVYNGTWFMPGGKSWASVFFTDAGGNYLWGNNKETGSLQLSFEAVYNKAHNAAYWLGAANYPSLQALSEADSRYQQFEAWQKGNVYTYAAKEGATGGNEYLELGYSRPDIVLADLIRVLHPELMPDHELYFYKKLPRK